MLCHKQGRRPVPPLTPLPARRLDHSGRHSCSLQTANRSADNGKSFIACWGSLIGTLQWAPTQVSCIQRNLPTYVLYKEPAQGTFTQILTQLTCICTYTAILHKEGTYSGVLHKKPFQSYPTKVTYTVIFHKESTQVSCIENLHRYPAQETYRGILHREPTQVSHKGNLHRYPALKTYIHILHREPTYTSCIENLHRYLAQRTSAGILQRKPTQVSCIENLHR